MPNMAGWADKIFQGRTKIFNTIAENFYPRTIFFFTGQLLPLTLKIYVKQFQL